MAQHICWLAEGHMIKSVIHVSHPLQGNGLWALEWFCGHVHQHYIIPLQGDHGQCLQSWNVNRWWIFFVNFVTGSEKWGRGGRILFSIAHNFKAITATVLLIWYSSITGLHSLKFSHPTDFLHGRGDRESHTVENWPFISHCQAPLFQVRT